MAVVQKAGEKQWFSDKTRFFKMMEEIDARSGIVADPTATVEKLREMLQAHGIRPEDNILSRDIIRARYPDEHSDEEGDRMAVVQKPGTRQWFSDKTKYAKLMEDVDAKAGIIHDPTMTAEKLQQMLIEEGILPEENSLSREIIRAKYPDEDEG